MDKFTLHSTERRLVLDHAVSQEGLFGALLGAPRPSTAESTAVFLAVKHFLQDLQGHHVLIRSDNMAAVGHVNKQGGLRSKELHEVAKHLTIW